ncbi:MULTISPECIES: FixH family protein [unclassified Caulobacter]|uniref:FixH family protein n=1 Tax=unclassified Caulobacter TaxID=2648921 RepID=UPI000D33D0FE|nr:MULTISPECIES: FixH family protein [unclassified Caulobacter]PTS87888.1 ferredoxin [Caulobacter sp. HMWF009]PTT06578.1 ferredoxin [Caulobacter sp. HMWF025]
MTLATTPQSTPVPPPEKGRITGWHVLFAVVAFFVIVIGVDAFFIVKAYSTFSGEVASNPYEAGLAFNRTLALREKEAALGWSAVVETPRPGIVAVQMKDRTGQPLTTLSLTGTLERPATETGRQVLDFKPTGEGWYEARATLDGAWDLRAIARNARDQFEVETRLVAP